MSRLTLLTCKLKIDTHRLYISNLKEKQLGGELIAFVCLCTYSRILYMGYVSYLQFLVLLVSCVFEFMAMYL